MLYHSNMNKLLNVLKIIILILLALIIFICVEKHFENKTFREHRLAERPATIAELDVYSMQEYCGKNAQKVFAALKAGDSKKLEKLMIVSEGLDTVMEFADWSEADFENAFSMGSGSLTPEPDEGGDMDVSERVFVTAGGTKYVFFIETITTEYGSKNGGVSAIGVTTFSHFDEDGWGWNGEKVKESALAGTLFWQR